MLLKLAVSVQGSEGEAPLLRRALTHPFGLLLLAASALVAGAMAMLPALAPWAARAPWVLLLGVLGYVAGAVVVMTAPSTPASAELRQLVAIRESIAARLAERRAASQGNSELTRLLADAVVQLDEEVIPALKQLLERQQQLAKYLARYEKGELPKPDAVVLDRLEAIHARQRAASEECIRHAVNADAALIALLQEGDDAKVAARAQAWSRDLIALYDSLAEVLRGGGEADGSSYVAEGVGVSTGEPGRASEPIWVDGRNGAGGQSAERFVQPIEEALRRLNNPAALSRCELIDLLPSTIAAMRASWGDAGGLTATPLENAQALREVLTVAVERLRPTNRAAAASGSQALHYSIISEAYVTGISNARIITKHAISESTFHRNRREAILGLAQELCKGEELLSQPKAEGRLRIA